jgi:hypothetical protein
MRCTMRAGRASGPDPGRIPWVSYSITKPGRPAANPVEALDRTAASTSAIPALQLPQVILPTGLLL